MTFTTFLLLTVLMITIMMRPSEAQSHAELFLMVLKSGKYAEIVFMPSQSEFLFHIWSFSQQSRVMFSLPGLRGLCWLSLPWDQTDSSSGLRGFLCQEEENHWPTLALFTGSLSKHTSTHTLKGHLLVDCCNYTMCSFNQILSSSSLTLTIWLMIAKHVRHVYSVNGKIMCLFHFSLHHRHDFHYYSLKYGFLFPLSYVVSGDSTKTLNHYS